MCGFVLMSCRYSIGQRCHLSLELELIGDCELHDVSARNQTVPLQERYVLLNLPSTDLLNINGSW